MTESDPNAQYTFILKTVQSSAFRCLIEALKEILTETNIEIDNDGLKIKAMNPSRTVLVHLKLMANKFEHFYCEKPFKMGVSMINMFKLIKMINNNDTLTLYIEKNAENQLGIKMENGEKNKMTTFKLNLIDLPNESIEIDPVEFAGIITMPSTEFQNTCKIMSSISQDIDIKVVNKHLIFSCEGDFASQTTEYGETNVGMSFVQNVDENEIVQGAYSLKYLLQFTKCTNLSNSIELLMKNDYPLIIRYQVAGLGQIKLCLVPEDPGNDNL